MTITEALESTHCGVPWPPRTGHLPQIIQESMVSGNPYANRREARKLGLFRKKKFRRFTRAKVAAGANERVCGEWPTPMLVPLFSLPASQFAFHVPRCSFSLLPLAHLSRRKQDCLVPAEGHPVPAIRLLENILTPCYNNYTLVIIL